MRRYQGTRRVPWSLQFAPALKQPSMRQNTTILAKQTRILGPVLGAPLLVSLQNVRTSLDEPLVLPAGFHWTTAL